MKVFLFTFGLLVANTAAAAPRCERYPDVQSVHVIIAKGSGISRSAATALFRGAAKLLPPKIKLTALTVKRAPYGAYETLGKYTRLIKAAKRMGKRGADRYDLTFVIFGALQGPGGEGYIGGISSAWDQVGCIAAKAFRTTSEATFLLDKIALTHEMGHLFGADHDNSDTPPSVMHEDALRFVKAGVVVGFSEFSVSQMCEPTASI